MSKKAIQYGKPVQLPDEYGSLGEMLVCISEKFPTHGMTFVNAHGEEKFNSYVNLLNNATKYLAILNEMGFEQGDILILLINEDLEDFYNIFWACILGGIIVAPINQPSFENNSATLAKLKSVWEVLNKPTIIVEEKYKKYYMELKESSDFSSMTFFSVEDLKAIKENINKSKPYTKLNDIAILQFSSGSTGIPKGVQLTHKNIITNLIAIKNSFDMDNHDNVFTWLPHTHDMGLFLQYLSSVIAGANIFIFSPMTFCRSPYLFLKKVTEHHCTWFGTPNFGLDWMIKNINEAQLKTLDFKSLKFILTGSEPISINIVNEFIKKFSCRGMTYNKIRAAYGMAEVTVCATTEKIHKPLKIAHVNRDKLINEFVVDSVDKASGHDLARYVYVGYPIEGISVRIADENGNTLDEGIVGRVQLKGESTTIGYYNLPEINSKMFIKGWLDTGDLGYMSQGSLVITGRIKDIIFVRGQNFFAHDLEELIFNTLPIQRGNLLVTGVYNDKKQTEELLVFIKHRTGINSFITLRQQVIDLLKIKLALEVTHVIPSKTIPKTTSGKLQRYSLQKAYLIGSYDTIINEISQSLQFNLKKTSKNSFTQNRLEESLRDSWAIVLGIPKEEIGVDDDFLLLGGNSVKAFQMLNQLANDLGIEIDSNVLIVCKTIRDIINYINKNNQSSNRTSVHKVIKHSNVNDFRYKDIAITGLALKLPQANTQEEFWNNLVKKKDCIKKISEKRKKLSNFLEWDDWLGEISDIEYFDNDFFNITANEASIMDPQQRLLLEISYHALEDAGVMPSLEDSLNIGVYSGISMNTYFQLVIDTIKKRGIEDLPQNTLVGNLSNIISARLSNIFNFTGPSLTIDTACSSALAALHYAVDALRKNTISGALVTSANLILTPEIHMLTKKAGIISSTNHAKVFDKDADGSILGEGILSFYLEPLEDALKKKKNVYAVIRGTAINNNGSTYGIMSPNINGQKQVLLESYADAAFSPEELTYIEVHGTGTVIGDPIEINALSKMFNEDNLKKESIGIGSIKTNVGHLLSAAGAAGLAKLLLCLKHKTLIPNLHFNQLNPYINLKESPFYIVRDVVPWEVADGNTRKAGISSFGFGGTNAHVVLEEWNDEVPKETDSNKSTFSIAALSAKSKVSLDSMIMNTLKIFENDSEISARDFCYTRNRYRAHYMYRSVMIFINNKYKTLIQPKKKLFPSTRYSSINIKVLIDGLNQSSNKKFFYKNALKRLKREARINHFFEMNLCEDFVYALYWMLLIKDLQQYLYMPTFKLNVDSSNVFESFIDEKIDFVEMFTVLENNDNFKSSLSRFSSENGIDFSLNLGDNREKILFNEMVTIKIPNSLSNHYDFQLLYLLGELYCLGVDIRWEKLHPDGSGKIISIPTYPFNSKPYWIESCL